MFLTFRKFVACVAFGWKRRFTIRRVWRAEYVRHVMSDSQRTDDVDYVDDNDTADNVSTSTSNELLSYFRSKYQSALLSLRTLCDVVYSNSGP